MADKKKKYYNLDDIGVASVQKKMSAAAQKYHAQKTSKIFKSSAASRNKKALKTV